MDCSAYKPRYIYIYMYLVNFQYKQILYSLVVEAQKLGFVGISFLSSWYFSWRFSIPNFLARKNASTFQRGEISFSGPFHNCSSCHKTKNQNIQNIKFKGSLNKEIIDTTQKTGLKNGMVCYVWTVCYV